MPRLPGFTGTLRKVAHPPDDPAREVKQALARLRGASTMFSPVGTIGVSKDDPDNRFLECAEAAGARYLVTGNLKHFPKPYKGTQVVTARRLLELLIPSR